VNAIDFNLTRPEDFIAIACMSRVSAFKDLRNAAAEGLMIRMQAESFSDGTMYYLTSTTMTFEEYANYQSSGGDWDYHYAPELLAEFESAWNEHCANAKPHVAPKQFTIKLK